MGSLIKFVRQCISSVKIETSESDAKLFILEKLNSFLEERIQCAGDNIARRITSLVRDNDVILTFGTSALIRKVIVAAARKKKFDLVVVDTRPLGEGLRTLSSLPKNVRCQYVPLSGASHVMKRVSRVILGASCLMANGSMLAPAGSAMVASLARARQIPVVVAVESFKFSEKVQLDSMVFNELGSIHEIIMESLGGSSDTSPQTTRGYRSSACNSSEAASETVGGGDFHNGEVITVPTTCGSPSSAKTLPFEVLNLRFDLTPISSISVVATETGLIPPTSVPVLIRELSSEPNL